MQLTPPNFTRPYTLCPNRTPFRFRHIIIIEVGQLGYAIAAGLPRERRRCPAWCSSAVFTEWCRSFGALPSRTRDSGRDYCPAGCEVRRQVLQEESSPRITC